MYIQQCVTCQSQYDQKTFLYTCPNCGDLFGTIDIVYDYPTIKKTITKSSLKKRVDRATDRYAELMPLKKSALMDRIQKGMTPLLERNDLVHKFNISQFYLKDDSFHPSLSLKDRASSVSVLKAKELGFDTVSTASTGNAAASLACIGAQLDMRTVIFVPASIPKAKLLQLKLYGATIITIKDNYDAAFDLCRRISEKMNWYNRSTAINPFNLEGKKTVAFEICEQLDFCAPEIIFIPVGDGCIISAVWKGMKEFFSLGLIKQLPRLIACQAEGSAAIYKAFLKNRDVPESVNAHTIADSISVDLPRDGVKALRALKESAGDAIIVSDTEILTAQKILAQQYGRFCEPSAACSYAGFVNYYQQNKIQSTDSVLVLLTGSGMKDLTAAQKSVSGTKKIDFDPTHDSLDKLLKQLSERKPIASF